MLRLILFLLTVAAAAFGLSWLADRPGSLLITWQGYEIETSVFRASVMLAALIGLSAIGWSISDDDLAEIDAIFERHGVNTVPEFWIEDD